MAQLNYTAAQINERLAKTDDIPSAASDIATSDGISTGKNVQSDLTQIAQNIGTLTDLKTDSKILVGAVNETYDKVSTIYDDYINAQELM